jgi:hypothetical protein
MNTETNYQIEIIHDEHPSNPRTEWDNLGTMVCFHRRYTLGDIGHGYRSSDFNSWDELKQLIIKQVKPAVILPIYMYDHSGITISTQPFGCRFDSGQIGFIYIGKLKVMKEYNVKRISRKLKDRLTEYLKGEVEYYDNYLTGETYGYKITKDGEEIDSCWGYYGYEDVKNVANEQLMYYKSKEVVSL